MINQKRKLGNSGEDLASSYLESKQYKILERNFVLKYGEIDIIAQDGDYIVLVEVKTKRNIRQGRPEDMVDYFKKRKLRLLARGISQLYPDNNIRIDVVAIDMTSTNPKINHIISAVESL